MFWQTIGPRECWHISLFWILICTLCSVWMCTVKTTQGLWSENWEVWFSLVLKFHTEMAHGLTLTCWVWSISQTLRRCWVSRNYKIVHYWNTRTPTYSDRKHHNMVFKHIRSQQEKSSDIHKGLLTFGLRVWMITPSCLLDYKCISKTI